MSEPHKVKRAIIMAAGTGNRMLPITAQTPKPLVEVNGIRMIDSVVDALHQVGITDIYVVAGYLKEQFYEWKQKYPEVKIVENDQFSVCNNISSLYVARHLLDEDCMILDADQIINDPQVLKADFSCSGYASSWCDHPTKEWLLEVQGDKVQSCSRGGGPQGWRLYSVSRWTKKDARKLASLATKEFECGNRHIYWDDIPVFIYKDQFDLKIFKISEGDVEEIDSLAELAEKDNRYQVFLSDEGKVN